LTLLFSIVTLCEPKKKTTNVWINKYKESSPKMLGVKIRLFVIVWKIIDENAMQPPVRHIANILVALLGMT
jgi:hypothetical protein